MEEDDDCGCDWRCDGFGELVCYTCGGDFCICACGGGPIECYGCEACGGRDAEDDE